MNVDRNRTTTVQLIDQLEKHSKGESSCLNLEAILSQSYSGCLAAYLQCFSVCVCACVRCSNSPLSLEQMPVTDVIQLAAVIVNNTMNGELTNLLRPSIRTSQLIGKTIKWQH